MATVIARVSKAARIDAGLNLDQFATIARSHGLPWSTARMVAFERGRVSPTLPTLIALAATLADVTKQPFTLADLFAVEDRIEVNKTMTLPALKLRKILGGEPVALTISDTPDEGKQFRQALKEAMNLDSWPESLREVHWGHVREVMSSFTEADLRVARSLEISRLMAAAAMYEKWKMSFTAKRDQEAKPGDNAQARGRISRELKAELSEFLAD
jgi:DNA-binding XRE family transcriptional regulator